MHLQSHTLSNVLHIEGDASAKQELLNDFTSQLIRLHKSTYAIPPESLHQGIYDTFDALRAYTPGFTIHLIRAFTIPSTHYVHKQPHIRIYDPLHQSIHRYSRQALASSLLIHNLLYRRLTSSIELHNLSLWDIHIRTSIDRPSSFRLFTFHASPVWLVHSTYVTPTTSV